MLDPREWPARCGVKPGDNVLLMADLTRIAWQYRKAGGRFNAAMFLEAFVQAVSPDGDILIPTYNYDLLPGDAFNVLRTRSISGALAQAALAHPAFSRTPHALHSFAVAGAYADQFVRADQTSSFGQDSPFAFLHAHQGVLISVDLPLNDTLTFVHYVEECVGVPYRAHTPFPIRYTDANGVTHQRTFSAYAKHPGHHMDFAGLEPLLTSAGALHRIDVDGHVVERIDLSRAYSVIEQDIRHNGARTIHRFSPAAWLKHHVRNALRTFGIRTAHERAAHAARTA